MNYDGMSDFEVNKRLSELTGEVLCIVQSASIKSDVNGVLVKTENKTRLINHCNNWSDIGPLIERYDISIVRDAAEDLSAAWWNASTIDNGIEINYCKNPKRAAAICIIKLLESENE